MKLVDFLEAIAVKRGWALALHVIAVLAIAWIPAQLIDFVVVRILPGPGTPFHFKADFKNLIGALLLAPLLETFIMRVSFRLLAKIIKRKLLMVAVSTVFWAVMHFNGDHWGLPAVWAFGVMGICYLSLDAKSPDRALILVSVIHMAFNALSYGVYHLSEAIKV